MQVPKRSIRALIVVTTAIALVVMGFALANRAVLNWGSTASERARQLPHDERLPAPLIVWNHGMTIDAPAEEVWQWIAQIGDKRGGFYSYTFIENLAAGSQIYRNANRILPELQNPSPGTPLIGGVMTIAAVDPPNWLLAEAEESLGIGWTWIWTVRSVSAGRSRLFVRTRIQPPGAPTRLGILGTLINTGGFVMERKMFQGIRDRSEGHLSRQTRFGWEAAVWLCALFSGLAAGVFAIFRRRWLQPYLVGIAAIGALFTLTFIQPLIWARVLIALLLAVGLVWAWGMPDPLRTSPASGATGADQRGESSASPS